MQNLQKRIAQLEGDLDQAQTQLDEATQKLENTEKQLGNVSIQPWLQFTPKFAQAVNLFSIPVL